MTRRRAVFLDRDGVIAELVWQDIDRAYESAALRDVSLVPDAGAALRTMRDAGFLTVVVSNQPAAAKGTASRADLEATHRRIVALLSEVGSEVDEFRYCLHHPRGIEPDLTKDCACRKPEPGLILAAAADLDIDIGQSWMIGDADTDIEAGRRAGCRTILIEHPLSAHRRGSDAAADYRVRNLAEAADIVTAGPA